MNISKVKKVCRSFNSIAAAEIAEGYQFVGVPFAMYCTGGICWTPEQLCELFGFDHEQLDNIITSFSFELEPGLFKHIDPGDTLAYINDISFIWRNTEYVTDMTADKALVLQKRLLEPVLDTGEVTAVRNGKLVIANKTGTVIGVVAPESDDVVIELLSGVKSFAYELEKQAGALTYIEEKQS